MGDMSPSHRVFPSSPPRSNFVKLTNGAARRDSAGIPKFDRASYITRGQGRRGFPAPSLSSSNIEKLKGESREGGIDRDGGARRLWLIFAIIQSVCWCSRIPWMEGGKPISISAPLSLLFCLFRFGAAGHSSVHAKGLPVLCLPIPNFSREIDLLFDCPRERGGGQSSLFASLKYSNLPQIKRSSLPTSTS